jgi:hypothetical protein
MEIVKAKMANAMTSAASDHIIAVTGDIYDETKNSYQSDINSDFERKIAALSSSIKPSVLPFDGTIDVTSESSWTLDEDTIQGNLIDGYKIMFDTGLKKFVYIGPWNDNTPSDSMTAYVNFPFQYETGVAGSDDYEYEWGITKVFNNNGAKYTWSTDGQSLVEYSTNSECASKEYVEEAISNLVATAPETLDTLKELADAIQENKDVLDGFATKDEVNSLKDKLYDQFWSSATFSLSASKSAIYADEATLVTFTAKFTSSSISDAEIDNIRITSDNAYNSVIAEADNSSTTSTSDTITLAAGGSKTLYAKATVGSKSKTGSATVKAYNKVYYGSSAAKPDSVTGLTALAATSTATGKTLTFTASDDGHAFYLLVPNDVTQPTKCTNTGGVDQGFTDLGDIVVSGITYNIYRLGGASYNKGQSFTFKTA